MFKSKHSLEQRTKDSSHIMSRHPSRIPVIVERAHNCTLDKVDKDKYLVPKDMQLCQFIYIIRKRIKLDDNETVFLFVNDNVLPPTSSTISSIYDQNKDEDGFLYISYCNENVFG